MAKLIYLRRKRPRRSLTYLTPPLISSAVGTTGLGPFSQTFSGLITHYTFDSGTAADVSGNGNNGTLENSPAVVAGLVGSEALSFNGSNQYIETTTQFTNPQTFSLSVWFETTVASGHKIIGFGNNQNDTASTDYDRHLYMGTDGKIYAGVYDGATETVSSSAALTDGNKHNAVLTFDGTNLTLYIDGVSQGTVATSGAQVFNGYWTIGGYKSGSWPNAADGYFSGVIDDPQIYNVVLNSTQVSQIYSAGVSLSSASIALGVLGMIGTSQGVTVIQAFNANNSEGTSVASSTVIGVMNASAAVGTAVGITVASGDINAAASLGSSVSVTTAMAVSGNSGFAAGISSSTAFATTQVQEVAQLSDFENRFRSLLPPSWFEYSSDAPVLNIPVAGMSFGLLWIYILYLYTIQQSRIQTASGVWLDRIAYDFFGPNLPRLGGGNESDSAYSARIRAAIVAPKQTRASISDSLEFLTGKAPDIIELWNPGDVGCYGLTGSNGIGTQGYGAAGMYGSLSFPNQFLVNAFRPSGEGIPGIPGYGNVGWGYAAGNGPGEYCDISDIVATVKDSDIYANIASIVAAGNTAWTAILSAPDTVDAPTTYFGNVNNSSYVAVIGSGFFF